MRGPSAAPSGAPSNAGESNPKLRRLGPVDAGTSRLWLLNDPQLRVAARISAFMRDVRGIVAEERARFEGHRPFAPST